MIGSTTIGTTSSTSPASLGAVTTMKISPPTNVIEVRSAIEIDEPTTDWISVVSVVSRDSTSPVIIRSKNPGLMPMTLS